MYRAPSRKRKKVYKICNQFYEVFKNIFTWYSNFQNYV